MEWVLSLSPAVILGIVVTVIIGRIHKQLDEKMTEKRCQAVHAGLEKEIGDIKHQNGKIFDKIERDRVDIAEIRKDIRYIVDEIKKQNGGK